jgi:hypothetical protein
MMTIREKIKQLASELNCLAELAEIQLEIEKANFKTEYYILGNTLRVENLLDIRFENDCFEVYYFNYLSEPKTFSNKNELLKNIFEFIKNKI